MIIRSCFHDCNCLQSEINFDAVVMLLLLLCWWSRCVVLGSQASRHPWKIFSMKLHIIDPYLLLHVTIIPRFECLGFTWWVHVLSSSEYRQVSCSVPSPSGERTSHSRSSQWSLVGLTTSQPLSLPNLASVATVHLSYSEVRHLNPQLGGVSDSYSVLSRT